MLRSFGYAAAYALHQGVAPGPADRARLAAPLAQWRSATEAAFLDGYRGAIGNTSSWPQDAAAGRRLLDALTLEKALYELRYELANRPDWAGIPLTAVLEQLDGGAA
jgi:maltose alpha-D-glucosyltransferase/alpha-amylase